MLASRFERHRARLLRMAELRADPALRQRIGASDVLRETRVEVSARIEDGLGDPRMPFFIWVRYLAAQRLQERRRFHVETEKRGVGRQVGVGAFARAASVAPADRLAPKGLSPSGAAVGLSCASSSRRPSTR